MKFNRPYCLSIAGFDPSAGAGVLADVKTFETIGVYGFAVACTNTVQDDTTFLGMEKIDDGLVKKQIAVIMQKFPINYVKIGLVKDYDQLKTLIRAVKELNSEVKIVWDPIIKSSSGFQLHKATNFDLQFIAEEIEIITPNTEEFKMLWKDGIESAQKELKQGAIVLKGGHAQKRGTDTIITPTEIVEIEGESFNGLSKHGTGCVYSSALTAYLALGNPLNIACQKAKTYVEQFILSNDSSLGYHSDSTSSKTLNNTYQPI